MRRGVRKVLILAVVATAASGAPAQAQQGLGPDLPENQRAAAQPARKKAVQVKPAMDPNDPRMKELLADWEKKSAKIKTLDVLIQRKDKSQAWGDEEFVGRALLQAPNLAWLDFRKIENDEKGKPKLGPDGKVGVHFERIVCTGSEVWQFKPANKQIFVFPLDKQNKQKALEEGPLPFLFNMKAAEAEARYVMALINEKKEAYVISIVPRLLVDQEAFSKALIVLDRETKFPTRIILISPDGTSTKDYILTDVRQNQPISPANFKPTNPGRPWEIVRDLGGNAPAPEAGAGVPRRQNRVPAAENMAPRNAVNGPLRRPPN